MGGGGSSAGIKYKVKLRANKISEKMRQESSFSDEWFSFYE